MESFTHNRIHDLLLTATHPIFISDERIDGDSLGSALAVVDYLKQHRKEVPVFVAEPVPEQYKFLPHINVCTTDVSVFDDPGIDLVVVFDCSDGDFVARLVDRIPSSPPIINIDHHKTNGHYGQVNQVLIDASATAEVVYRFFEANHLILTKEASICLLTGLCFDTNVFSNSATSERAFTIASQLILSGARVQDIIHSQYQNRSVSVLRVWGSALERLLMLSVGDIVVTFITRKDLEENAVSDDEIDGLSNFLNLVTDTDTLFVLRETKEGGVKVSMRSRVHDVSALARIHGGGGHTKAAGFTLPFSRLVTNETGHWQISRSDGKERMEDALRVSELLKTC